MQIAILPVDDEVFAGDTANSNATWLASWLTASGATVERILTHPDDRDLIADRVCEWADAYDAVIVTGGFGDTPDDVTVDAFDREPAVNDAVREDVLATVAAYRDANPKTVAVHDVEIDVVAWASLPAGSRALINPNGLCPGCVLENVYAFHGISDELKALFEFLADEFDGDAVSTTLYTPQPEGSMITVLDAARERFAVGSYPSTEGHNRLKVLGTDGDAVAEAVACLRERVEIIRETR